LNKSVKIDINRCLQKCIKADSKMTGVYTFTHYQEN